MYYAIWVMQLQGHWKRKQKFQKMLNFQGLSVSPNLFKAGVYKFGDSVLEIRENTISFDVLEALKDSQLNAALLLAVYDDYFKEEEVFAPVKDKSVLHPKAPVIVSLAAIDSSSFLVTLQNVENKEALPTMISFHDFSYSKPGNIIIERLHEMQRKFFEVVKYEN